MLQKAYTHARTREIPARRRTKSPEPVTVEVDAEGLDAPAAVAALAAFLLAEVARDDLDEEAAS